MNHNWSAQSGTWATNPSRRLVNTYRRLVNTARRLVNTARRLVNTSRRQIADFASNRMNNFLHVTLKTSFKSKSSLQITEFA